MRWNYLLVTVVLSIVVFTGAGCAKQSCIEVRLDAMEKITADYEDLARTKDLDLIEFTKRNDELKAEVEAFGAKLEADMPECASDTTTWTEDQLKRKQGFVARLETAGRQITLRMLKGQ